MSADAARARARLIATGESGRVITRLIQTSDAVKVELSGSGEPDRMRDLEHSLALLREVTDGLAVTFARVACDLVGSVQVRGSGDVPLGERVVALPARSQARLGILCAGTLSRYDPRVHGGQVAAHELRKLLEAEILADRL